MQKVSSKNPAKLVPIKIWADSMGVSVWTARRWMYEGKIASVKISKCVLIPAGEDERLIKIGYRPANPVS